jgi:hypothetical protein
LSRWSWGKFAIVFANRILDFVTDVARFVFSVKLIIFLLRLQLDGLKCFRIFFVTKFYICVILVIFVWHFIEIELICTTFFMNWI